MLATASNWLCAWNPPVLAAERWFDPPLQNQVRGRMRCIWGGTLPRCSRTAPGSCRPAGICLSPHPPHKLYLVLFLASLQHMRFGALPRVAEDLTLLVRQALCSLTSAEQGGKPKGSMDSIDSCPQLTEALGELREDSTGVRHQGKAVA